MILYHRTTAASADCILRDGFRDGTGTYMMSREYTGVWLSDVPLDGNEGAHGDTLLRLELPEQPIAEFEWIEEGKPYREWLIPAKLVNEQGAGLCVIGEDEEDAALADYRRRHAGGKLGAAIREFIIMGGTKEEARRIIEAAPETREAAVEQMLAEPRGLAVPV